MASDNVEQVAMKDGRTVGFAGKKRAIKSSDFTDNEVHVKIDFRNGETRTYVVPSSLTTAAAQHGAEQKYGDSYAGLDDIDDMIEACDKVQENLFKGDWNARVEGSGFAGTSVLARALAEYTGQDLETKIRPFLKTRSQADKLALRNSTRPNKAGVTMKAIIDRLEAEKVTKASKVDVEKQFAELEAAGAAPAAPAA